MKCTLLLLFLFFGGTVGCTFNYSMLHNENQDDKTRIKSYFLNIDLGGDYEIYVNGINLLYHFGPGVNHGYEQLNPLFLKNGKQEITMKYKYYPEGVKINFAEIDEIFLEIYVSENGENPPFKMLKKLSFPAIAEPQDSLIYTWEFDANVEYSNNALDNALDLSSADISSLTTEVIAKYQEVHAILHAGNTKAFRALFDASLEREANSTYYSEAERKSYISDQLVNASKAKGTMLQLEKFKLKVHLNNKTFELINLDGNSPLISKDNEGYTRIHGFYLYKDKITGELKVF